MKNGEKTNATALGIDEDGGLIVKLENGEYTVLRGGEISVRIR
jgi:biotin-(acetyl-CoA carboxylase) ligase